jgi:hypothetical protein
MQAEISRLRAALRQSRQLVVRMGETTHAEWQASLDALVDLLLSGEVDRLLEAAPAVEKPDGR